MQPVKRPIGHYSGNHNHLNALRFDISGPIGQNGRVLGIGDVVRRLRKDLDLTLEELAARARVSKTTLAEIESGKGDPRLSTLSRIGPALNTSVAYLVADAAERHKLLAMTGPVNPASTNRDANIPKGGAEDDAASLGPRELAARIEAQGRELEAMRNVLDSLAREATERGRPAKTPSTQTRRGKRD